MKYAKIGLAVVTLLLVVKPVFAISYMFSEGGWPGCGEVTGSFDIDLNHSTADPGYLYGEALNSFSAHWSGNIYSQPYDWDLSDVSFAYFLFSINQGTFVDMVLDGAVQYDITEPLVWDERPDAIKVSPDWTWAQYYGTGPLVVTRTQAVPDTNNTFVLMVLAFSSLFGLTRVLMILKRWGNIKRLA